jgi:DNA-directed RNA polymerase subunit omega
MARITVEDCLQRIPNRFSLVLVAAERTKQILKGAATLIPNDKENKEAVTALREIAAGSFRIDDSAVLAEDRWMPTHRRKTTVLDEDLPPEA